jgi:hypothetical protein
MVSAYKEFNWKRIAGFFGSDEVLIYDGEELIGKLKTRGGEINGRKFKGGKWKRYIIDAAENNSRCEIKSEGPGTWKIIGKGASYSYLSLESELRENGTAIVQITYDLNSKVGAGTIKVYSDRNIELAIFCFFYLWMRNRAG